MDNYYFFPLFWKISATRSMEIKVAMTNNIETDYFNPYSVSCHASVCRQKALGSNLQVECVAPRLVGSFDHDLIDSAV